MRELCTTTRKSNRYLVVEDGIPFFYYDAENPDALYLAKERYTITKE